MLKKSLGAIAHRPAQATIITMTTTTQKSNHATTQLDVSSMDTLFSPELLSEPLLSYTKEALTATPETAANKYNVLEAQLRGHLLSLIAQNDLEQLQQEWKACWNICIYILQENSSLDGLLRKLPFLLLEDVAECLSCRNLETFYQSSLDTTTTTTQLSTGPLWALPVSNTSHVLQYIRLQNTLLRKLPNHAGKILMEMSRPLSLSDRSALKLWGSVSGRTVDEYDQEEEENELDQEEQDEQRSFHETFWSVQRDMQNPYKIHFAHFFTCCKQILAALESNHATTISLKNKKDSSTSKYLTKPGLLSLQLQDATFCQHWLTQFLILQSLFSWQSTQLKSTLEELTLRAKALLRKLPSGPEYLSTLEETLHHSEVYWRQWKKAKCKPDMEMIEADEPTIPTTPNDLIASLPPNVQQQSTLLVGGFAKDGQDHGSTESSTSFAAICRCT